MRADYMKHLRTRAQLYARDLIKARSESTERHKSHFTACCNTNCLHRRSQQLIELSTSRHAFPHRVGSRVRCDSRRRPAKVQHMFAISYSAAFMCILGTSSCDSFVLFPSRTWCSRNTICTIASLSSLVDRHSHLMHNSVISWLPGAVEPAESYDTSG